MLKELGLTITEFVMVGVILSVIAVIAIPKFMNFSNDAQVAATNSLAADLTSISAANYAARSANATHGVAIANCTHMAYALSGGALPTGYTINSVTIGSGRTVTCNLTGPANTTATFEAIGIS